MKNLTPIHRLCFDELTSLFTRKSESTLSLEPEIGGGSVQIVKLDRGLELRFWHCCFNHGIELNGHANPHIRNRYFTLLCFLTTEGISLYTNSVPLKGDIIWNSVFLSSKSNYKMYIAPLAIGQCISISFTKTWLTLNVLETNQAFANLGKEVAAIDTFSLLGTMTAAEKKTVEELYEFSWKKSFGILYLKSLVLKIIGDFLYRIKERERLTINNLCIEKPVEGISKYLK